MDCIIIKGYKSFKDLDLPMNKINIFIGANGSGKSNFLSFFEFLNALYEQRLNQYVALGGGTDRFLFNGSKVTGSIYAKVKSGHNDYSFEIQQGVSGFVFTHERLGYCNDQQEISSNGTEAGIKNYSGLTRGDYMRRYLESIKKYHFHDTGLTSPFTRTSNIHNDGYYLYGNGQNIAAFLYEIRERQPMVYRRIVKVIQSVAPYFGDFFFSPNETGDVRLLWKSKYSEMLYGATDFSDGTIRFIALTTLFLQPAPPEVIIIDEPELGLHPFAIEKLAGLIRSVAGRGSQVIIATQSAGLISNFNPEDILTVHQLGGESKVRRLNSDELRSWLNDYSLGELWSQNIMDGGQPR